MNPAPVTFLLPGDNLSGGVRVTARMADLLLERGHPVRIALPARWRRILATPSLAFTRPRPEHGWLRTFRGPIQTYHEINRLRFGRGEIVIGVGTYMIRDLQRLRARDIVKVRYNHGLPARMTPAYRAAWSLPIPTVTVSPTLAARLEALSGQPVQAVIPNGLDPAEYFPVAGASRTAIGTIYADHPNKAPREVIGLLRRIAGTWPDTPLVVFSTEPRPPDLPATEYAQSPSVAQARALYNRALIWLLASHTEGLPAPVLEAMACGAVVISTDNDGSLALIRDGENGLIVPRGDLAAFIDRIDRVRRDPGLRQRLTAGGFATAADFTWAAAAAKMEAFLHSLARPATVP